MTRSGVPSSGPWKPRTCAAATAAPRYGSSPAPSMIRPQRGSRAMSTIGANVQWMPTARASRAATAWPPSMVSGSQEAAIAIGTGKMVRSPWITSKPNSTGMPRRLPSTASRCSRLVSAGSVRNNNEPAPPCCSFDSTILGCSSGSKSSTGPGASSGRRK